MTDDEIVDAIVALRDRTTPGAWLICGGFGDDVLYVGLRHADGSEEFATPRMAAVVRRIDESATLPVHQRAAFVSETPGAADHPTDVRGTGGDG